MPTWKDQERGSFREEVCLPMLRQSQNPDGGWGYRPQSKSRTEPTSWALVALRNLPQPDPRREALDRGTGWLLRAQLGDGGWPSDPEQKQGDWCTSLALLALPSQESDSRAVTRGLEWLGRTWPAEGGFWWRLRHWFERRPQLVRQNFALRGWNWTPGTSSWVEPTSYALLALESREIRDGRLLRRRQLGEAMLLDRMCPGGGWNAGNPLVYGVAGTPAMGPTVWALLALRGERGRKEITQSLDWLESAAGAAFGPASLALAHLCLETFGRKTAPLEPLLRHSYESNQFLDDVLTFAWATLALTPERTWPPSPESGIRNPEFQIRHRGPGSAGSGVTV
jgi:hypothetical protein